MESRDLQQTLYRLEKLASHDAASFDGRISYLDDRENGAGCTFERASQMAFAHQIQGEYVYEATFWAGYALGVFDYENQEEIC